MIKTLEEAKAIYHKHSNKDFQKYYDDELVIMDEHTIVKDYGWVFVVQSKKYLETKNVSHLAIGGTGILLKDGSIVSLGTALPVEQAIAKYEKTRKEDS